MATETPPNRLELVRRAESPKRPSSGLLRSIEEEVVKSSRQLIEHMFSATDDLFYELSKRASSNNEQNLYFESMREIRIKKEGLLGAFVRNLERDFSQLFQLDPMNPPTRRDEDITLSIVEGDDLEIDLALKNMANRARESFKTELYELSIRLDHLLLQRQVDETNNPLDPQQIAKAFVDACLEKLNISIKTRLILFKLFEKHVLKQLGPVYAEANQMLVDSGILPKVPRNLVKGETAERPVDTPAQAHAEAPHATSAAAPAEAISISPQALASLMMAIRGSQDQIQYHSYVSNPGPPMPATDLLSILTQKQPVVDHKIARSEPKVVLRDLVSEMLAKRNPTTPPSLGQFEEDTINLVSLFFDKLLEDQELPLVVQSLICRLQIPVLKVALRDRSFLSNEDHPARQLINAVVRAGIQFDESKALERDPLYRTIVDGIQTINRQYGVDEGVFRQVQAELDALIHKESRKSQMVETRTTQTEIGKAKIRNAKSVAQTTLFDKLKDEPLPDDVSEFLTNTWLQVLVITHIKEGRDSAAWVENEQLVSDLVWICKSHCDDRSKARAQRLKPELLNRIEKGLELAIDNAETRSARIQEIERTLDTIVGNTQSAEVQFRNLSHSQRETLGKTESDKKSWDEMTAMERQQAQYEELSSTYFKVAKEVEEGSWFEYLDGDGKITRCKLSKKIEPDTYLFVNRFGFKVLEKTRREFAYDLQFNRVRAMNSQPVFDRIMAGIMAPFQQGTPRLGTT